MLSDIKEKVCAIWSGLTMSKKVAWSIVTLIGLIALYGIIT